MPRPQPTAKSGKPKPTFWQNFSAHWFWLVFWLTVIATVLISWRMVVAPGSSVVDF